MEGYSISSSPPNFEESSSGADPLLLPVTTTVTFAPVGGATSLFVDSLGVAASVYVKWSKGGFKFLEPMMDKFPVRVGFSYRMRFGRRRS